MKLSYALTDVFIGVMALWTVSVTLFPFRNRAPKTAPYPLVEVLAIGALGLYFLFFNALPVFAMGLSSLVENFVVYNVIAGPGFLVVAFQLLALKLASVFGVHLSRRQRGLQFAVTLFLVLANCLWLYLLKDFDGTRRG